MKKFMIIVAVSVLVSLAFVSIVVHGQATGTNPFLSKITAAVQDVKQNDKIVATVNGEPIYLSKIASLYLSSKYAYDVQKQYAGASLLPMLVEPDPVRSLDNTIDSKLLYQDALDKGYKADQTYLNSLIESQKKSFYSLLQGKADANAVPDERILFEEFSKAQQDMVNESGLSREGYFEQKYLPELEKAAVVQAMMSDSGAQATTRESLVKQLRASGKVEILDIDSVENLKSKTP